MFECKGLWISLLLCGISAVALVEGSDYKVVCYLGSWANYRNGKGKFVIEDIDPSLCTHLVYAFAKLENEEIKPYDSYLDLKDNWGLGAFDRFNGLKKKNPKLSTFIAIGGWNEGSTKYSAMASSAGSRKKFIDSCLRFLEKYGFDGVDMDWEYPANRGGKPSDKQNFVSLLKEMKEAFARHKYLLTAAVSAGQSTIDTAYDIPAISNHLDFINLMAYDFHGGWDRTTGLHSSLYSRADESANQKKLNADYAVRYWLKKGVPSKKLILGMGLYGRSFTLQDASKHGLGDATIGKGRAGPYTMEDGMLGYNEICEMVKPGKGWTVVFDEEQKVPYAYEGKQWVGYDDKKSIAMKVNYIKKMNLGGGMVWSIETDDFRGSCDGTRYPLLKTITTGLNGDIPIVEDPSTTVWTQPTPRETTTLSSASPRPWSETSTVTGSTNVPSSDCTKEGYSRDPNDCKKFMYCKKTEDNGFIKYDYNCGPGTVFSNKLLTCVFPYQAPECEQE